MSRRAKRKARRRKLLDARRETWAARSKYAAKVWEREHGQAPRCEAVSEARKEPPTP